MKRSRLGKQIRGISAGGAWNHGIQSHPTPVPSASGPGQRKRDVLRTIGVGSSNRQFNLRYMQGLRGSHALEGPGLPPGVVFWVYSRDEYRNKLEIQVES